MADLSGLPPGGSADRDELLMRAREEARYYQKIAEESGRRRLREIDQLARLIAECRRVEEALRESELKFRSLFDFSPQAIALTDKEARRLIEVNDQFCRLTGYSRDEVLGLNNTEVCFIPEPQATEMLKELEASGKVHGLEVDLKAKDGSTLHVLMFGRLVQIGNRVHTLTLFLDLTRQKHLEAQLQHAQKMEAIGTLAGGIAHDFNNLLMAIQGNVSLALFGMDPAHPHFATLKRIEKQVESGARLTSQLLGYARKGKYDPRPINLNRLVLETSEAFGRTRKEIAISHELTGGLLAVEVDQGQIEQVLLNLYVNAADAMPAGGNLHIETVNATHEDMKGKLYQPVPGNYVWLKVADTGQGMDEKTRQRIFEPFFTTKKMGRGTGLGLASVYGIVKAHGGYIDVDSHPGRGAAFHVFLPAAERETIPEALKPMVAVGDGKGTILVVDDEEGILEVEIDLLKKLGYVVLGARGGREAVELYREAKDGVDLILLDVVMPDMSGGETYDLMREINPGLKVLLCSGYSMDGQARGILDRGCNGFIQKPFTISELSCKIKEILAK